MRLCEILDVLEDSVNAPQLMNELLLRRLDRLKHKFIAAIGLRLDEEQGRKLIDNYEKLSTTHKARLLTGQQLCEAIQMVPGKAEHLNENNTGLSNRAWLELVEELIEDEGVIEAVTVGEKAPSPRDSDREIWGGIGDVKATSRSGLWVLDKMPTIGDCITVDFDSPLAKRVELRSGVLSRARAEIDEQQKNTIVRKLQEALDLIDELAPTYGLLIRNFTRRIIIRKAQGADASKISSEHVPRQPGSIRLLNPHLDRQTVAGCAESLLHESIHNFLAAWETAYVNFFDSDDRRRPISPWSGNAIPNPSLTHAVFVYYACYRLFYRYWKSCRGHQRLMTKDVAKRMNAFASGFLIEQPLSSLFVSDQKGPEGLADVLLDMQRKVKNNHLSPWTGLEAA